MKKFLLSASVMIATLVSLTGCAHNMPDGYETVKNAKELYETLDSAHVVMLDQNNGEQLMDFSFYLNKNDEMVFTYHGTSENGDEFAYSDGAEFFYKEAGAEGWHVIGSADEQYIYNVYNKKYRYPYATGNIFFLDATSVQNASVTILDDGSQLIEYTYDAEKLNSYAAEKLENVSEFKELTTTFSINSDGFIKKFTEVGAVIDEQGNNTEVNISIEVDKMNNVYEIPYPLDTILN